MTRTQAIRLIQAEINASLESARDILETELSAQGCASPLVEARGKLCGYDSGVECGSIAEGLLVHSIDRLESAGTVGTGRRIAYVGSDGYYATIRADATPEQVRQLVTTFLCD